MESGKLGCRAGETVGKAKHGSLELNILKRMAQSQQLNNQPLNGINKVDL